MPAGYRGFYINDRLNQNQYQILAYWADVQAACGDAGYGAANAANTAITQMKGKKKQFMSMV